MLLFLDGMAHYATADIGVKYTTRTDDFCVWSVASEGRFGNCLKRVSTAGLTITSGYLEVAPLATRSGLWTPQLTGVCGFAVKVDDLGKVHNLNDDAAALFMIQERSFYHIKVVLYNNGTFGIFRCAALGFEDEIGGSVEGLQSNSWAYVEFKWVLHETAGTFEIRVNTIPVFTFTGRTLADVSNTLRYWNAVRLFGVNSTDELPRLTLRVCDLYLADLTGSGGDVHDFLGDGVVSTIFPNGPGLAADWTPTPAAPNWDTVNDKPAPDGDATYVRTIAPGTRDVYQFEDIPVGSTILGVHYNLLLRKEDEGSVTVKPIVGQGSTQYDGPTQGVAATAYDRYLTQPYDLNPATGAPWTAAEINAGQWGILKVT